MTDPIEAERIVLGAALVTDGATLTDTPLEAHEFSRPPHRDLWTLMRAMAADGAPVNPVTVQQALANAPVRGVDLPYLHTLYASVPVAHNVGFYAGIVREHAELRAINAAGQKLIQASGMDEASSAKAVARQTLDSLDRRQSVGLRNIGDLVTDAFAGIERGATPGLSTPWADLDARLGGLRPGTSTVIAARPGLGKSIIGLQLAAHVADRHGPVLLHSLEMPASELALRLMSAASRVAFSSLHGKPNDLEWARLSKVLGDLSALPLHVDDRASVTVAEIAAASRRVARTGLELVVVDYLQLLTPTNSRIPREQQVAEQSRALKILAKDLNVPVVVLAQLNRQSETRADRRPALADLRESGAIESDADAVLLLYRDEDSAPDRLEVGIGKNRGGPRGMVPLHWDAPHMRVTSAVRFAS